MHIYNYMAHINQAMNLPLLLTKSLTKHGQDGRVNDSVVLVCEVRPMCYVVAVWQCVVHLQQAQHCQDHEGDYATETSEIV
jgi:hypothetical protein